MLSIDRVYVRCWLAVLTAASFSLGWAAEAPAPQASMPSNPEAAEIAQDLQGLLEKLMAQNDHLLEFQQASERVAAVCLDWSSVRSNGDATFLRIEHYWFDTDNGGVTAMRADSLDRCEKWKNTQQQPCECMAVVENTHNVVQVRKDVADRLVRMRAARQIATSAEYKRNLDEIAALRRRENLLSSDPASPYRVIEAIQKDQCQRNARWSAGCTFSKDACIESVNALSKKFGFEKSAEVQQISCSQISTTFETPGAFEMMARMHANIRAASILTDVRFEDSFAFGSLPEDSVNVSIAQNPISGSRLIFFNRKFFSFVYEMAKVASMLLPFQKQSSESLELRDTEDEFERFISRNPQVVNAFNDTVLTFLGIAQRPPIIPEESIRPILLIFTTGAEVFALAHEMAHSSLRHKTTSRANFDSHECVLGQNSKWIDEVEADYIAIKLLNSVTDIQTACSGAVVSGGGLFRVGEPLKHCDVHPFSLGLRLAPEFYFLAREVSREACSISTQKDDIRDLNERTVLEFAKRCRASQDCNFVRDLRKELPNELVEKQGHPHPAIRRELAKIWMDDPDLVGFENPVSSIGNSLTRNSSLIWQRSKASLAERIKSNK